MALAACRTLLALFVTFCAPERGWTAEKPLRPHNGKHATLDKDPREGWEPTIHLDGRPVDRFVISTNKPVRTHRFTKMGKDSQSQPIEDVEPEWVNLDGFAVLGGVPVSNLSTVPARSIDTAARHQPSVRRATRVDRTAHPLGVSNTRTQRRAPQSSSGPRQPDTPMQYRRRQHHTQPQSDQRNRFSPKLTSESVHVVSLQAQKAQGQSASANRAAKTKTTTPEPPEYQAEDISVRVMSHQSVLISWRDPALEIGMVEPSVPRFYTVRYREKGESARWEYKDSTQRRMLIDTLSADGMYEFSVRISEGQNQGKWSVSVFQRTPESAPSGPPENFEVKPLRGKGTTVIATWDPPEEPNGRIREYILSYAPAMKPFGMKSVTYRGSTTSTNIDGLTPGDRYIFKIRATNRRGQGPQSKAFSVVMPGSRSSALPVSATKESQRSGKSPSNQDTNLNRSNIQSTEEPQEPTASPQSHSSAPVSRRVRPLSQSRSHPYHSIFSSVRGSIRNVGNRGSSRGRVRDEEDEVEKEEKEIPTTSAPVKETTATESKAPNNEVSPESEDEINHKEPEQKTSETQNLKDLSPSPTKSTSAQQRRPLKVRIHQRPGVKTASSASSSPSSSSPSSTLLSSVPHIPESEADEVEKTPTYTQGKNTQTQVEDKPVGRGSVPAGRSSGFGSRYGYGRRQLGILVRGNSTRIGNGYKPGRILPSHSDSTSRTSNQETQHIDTSETSQPVLPVKSQDQDNFDKSQSTSESRSYDSEDYERTQVTNHNLQNNNDSNLKNAAKEETKTEEPTSSFKERLTEDAKREEEERKESSSEKHVVPRTRFQNPSRFGSGTSSRQVGRNPLSRPSSSVGAGRPVLKGTSARISGASGTAGVSSVQDTSEDLRTTSTNDSLKNGMGVGSSKLLVTNSNTGFTDVKNPTTSSFSTSSSSVSIASRSDQSIPVHIDSNEPHKETINSNTNDDKKDYLDVNNREHTVKTENIADTTLLRSEDDESMVTRQTPLRKRTGISQRRPAYGGNGRMRSPLFATRQFGGARVPIRPQQTQNSRLGSSTSLSTSPSSSNIPQPATSDNDTSIGTTLTRAGGLVEGDSRSTASSSSLSRDGFRGQGGRSRYPILRGKPNGGGLKPGNGNGKNGRPNLTATNDKESSSSLGTRKANGQRFITGPDGAKWVIDLENGLLMNQDGQVLQDSQGKPKRVVLGEDGRTIFDQMGSPLLNQEGMALFGHGRDSRPVVNPKDKVLTVGGKPLLGLDVPPHRTTTTTTTTTTSTTTATTTFPTTTPEPTTTEWTTEESTTEQPYPTCPPGTFSRSDDYGYPLLDAEGILDCYPVDELFDQTTLPPLTTAPTTTEILTPEPDIRPWNKGPSSEFDLSGKRRFTAPYVNYIRKDPGAPCSLTEALEYLQVDILENLIEKDRPTGNQNQPPKAKPHNLTVVAMEGCHSFIILDWARPLKDDMVSGYMVHSASYDDIINNRWSTRSSTGTHLPVENLKPNSRYYFKVQAKNVFGLGPLSETLTYVTESDDPLLIERPPGGEPIWIPYTFKFNPSHSSCQGSQYVKRTWYRKFVGVVLCNSLRYKIFMGDGLREPFYSIGDTFGQGEDHCQFVDSYRDGRTGPAHLSTILPTAQGYYRSYRQEPVTFGVIGRRTPHPFVGWYECGVPIPGKW